MFTFTWKIPNRVLGPEKAFNNFLVPSLPVKPKRAQLTQQGLLRSGGHRDSFCRSFYTWLRERIWGMDDESARSRCGPRPRDSEPTPRKGGHMLAQHLPPTYSKAKDKAVLGMPPGLEIPVQVMLMYSIAPSPKKPSLDEQGQPSSIGKCHVPGTVLGASSASSPLLSSKVSEIIQRWGTDPARPSFWSKAVQGVGAERDSQACVRISDRAAAAC